MCFAEIKKYYFAFCLLSLERLEQINFQQQVFELFLLKIFLPESTELNFKWH
jgi:hypothetical protein